MLTAYYDDTGKRKDTPVVCLFGFVADAEQWLRFDNDWRIVLGLPQFQLPYFHMREIRQAARAKNPAFHKFQNNDALRNDLFDRLQKVILVRVIESFSATVLMADYDRLNKEYEIEEQLGSPAAVATGVAIGKLVTWRKQKRPNEPFKVVCDEGMDEWGKLDDKVYEGWGFRLVPGVPSDTPGLQASDFAAWELQRAMAGAVRSAGTQTLQIRPTFRKFLEHFTVRGVDGRRLPWFLVDDGQLEHLIEVFSVPKRQSPPSAPTTPVGVLA